MSMLILMVAERWRAEMFTQLFARALCICFGCTIVALVVALVSGCGIDTFETVYDSGPGDAQFDGGADVSYPEGSVPDGFTNDGPCTGDCVIVPSGWTGPVAWWEGSGDAPDCTGAYTGAANDMGIGLNAAPATCSACSCSAPTSQKCTATVSTYEDSSCTDYCNSSIIVSGSGCTSFSPCGSDGDPATNQFLSYTWAVTGGSCTASGGSPTLPVSTWSMNARTCAYNASTGGTCASGTCYAPVSAPFANTCVYQTGDTVCPSAFMTKHLYYTGVDDSRSCTSCSCGSATGSCSGSLTAWHNASCSDFPDIASISEGSCQEINTAFYDSKSLQANLSVTGGSCPASGGAPTGGAVQADPITVCCQ
jgi:hypothetical protein